MEAKFFDPALITTSDQAVEFIGSILESSSGHSIIGVDLDGRILLWNEGACRLFGYRPEEIIGTASWSILHDSDALGAEQAAEMLEVAMRAGQWEGVIPAVRKDRSRLAVRTVLTLRRDSSGNAVGFLLLCSNVPNEPNPDARPAGALDSSIIGTADLARAAGQLALQHAALDSAAAIVITDAAGVIEWVNPAFTTTTGFSESEAIGQTMRILRSGVHDEAFYASFWKTILSGRMWRGEFVNRRSDGSIYYDETTVTSFHDDAGTITHFVGVMHDVTEWKESDEKLREARTQMRDLLEHSPAVLYALRIEGGELIPRLASENVSRMLGFTVAETLRTAWWREQLHPDDRALAEASLHEVMANGEARAEYRIRHRDGTYRWIEDNKRLVRDAAQQPLEIAGVWTDVTDRKNAQQNSLGIELRLRDMFDHLDLVMIMLDREGKLTYCNDHFLEVTGWHRDDVLGCDWIGVVVPAEIAPSLRSLFVQSLEGDESTRHHTSEILTQSGQRRLIRWNNTLLKSMSGEVIGIASIGEDVTSRVEAERAIIRNEERLRIIVAASSDAVWEWNIATRDGVWSDRAYAMLGYDRHSFHPDLDSFHTLLHPDDVHAFHQAIAEHSQRETPFQVRIRLRSSSGHYVPVLARGQLRREKAQMIGVFTDLSLVERAEVQIREQAALIDQARDAIVVRDLDDRILFWSKGAERLYEFPAAVAIGQQFEELLQVDRQRFASAKESVLAQGVWSGEAQKCAAGGRVLTVDCSWTLLRDDHGGPKSIFSIDTDMTDRKALEQQFFRAQRLDSLGTLAGGIAHDLNNLLMPILMGVTLLRRLEHSPKSVRAIDNIETSVRRGADLVKQVLLFARGVDGQRTPLDLATVVEEVQVILESTFPKNISFSTSVPSSMAAVLGDPTQLHQVVLNLCVNARDAMPTGGVIHVTASEQDVDQQFALSHDGAKAGRYVVLQVADAGVGMPADVMDRVFEPFFTTKSPGKGTGLGLSTARGIVRSHGGFIAVASRVDRGSAFCVYLPVHAGPAERLTIENDSDSTPSGRGELILVVDDEKPILDIARQTLLAFGYEVVTAQNGAQALSIFQERSAEIAAVITDVMMPVMDGHALITALQRIDPSVAIIAMSGHADPALLSGVTMGGAAAFLPKPFSAGAILQTLRRLLSRDAAAHRP